MENSNQAYDIEEHSSNISNQDLNEDVVIEDKITKTMKKNEQAKELIKKSEKLVLKADKEVEATKKSIIKDVNKFEEIKNSLLSTTIMQSKMLLEKASYIYVKPESNEQFEISLGTTHDNIKVNNISSGHFTAFILAILSMLATAIGLIFVASTQVGIRIEPTTIPDNASINKIMSWIGGGITGGEGNPLFGMITVGLIALIIGIIIYKIYLSIVENKNFKIANNTFRKAHKYLDKQKKSKIEMKKIDEHIKQVIPTLEDYQFLLNEQNAKLQRILHVEGELEDNNQYHQSSREDMQEIERLMEKVEELLIVPITKDGKINDKSISVLDEAKSVYDYYLSKIYS